MFYANGFLKFPIDLATVHSIFSGNKTNFIPGVYSFNVPKMLSENYW